MGHSNVEQIGLSKSKWFGDSAYGECYLSSIEFWRKALYEIDIKFSFIPIIRALYDGIHIYPKRCARLFNTN